MSHTTTMKVGFGAILLGGMTVVAMGFAEPPKGATAPGNSTPSRGHIAAPPGTETLTAEVLPLSIHMYGNDDFKGKEAIITGVDTQIQAGSINEMPKGLNDSMTSIRWNLPAGVVVVFYEDAGGKGEQLVLWGQGQSPDVSKWDFNDKASRWAWYNVGGGNLPRSAGESPRPNGAKPVETAVPENAVQFFIDKNFKNDMEQVAPLTGQAFGELHRMPKKMGDSLTSMRWNLPEGVIILLYQDADGKKQQVAIFGEGEIADLDLWDFNDKISRWSWAYVGAPATAATSPRMP